MEFNLFNKTTSIKRYNIIHDTIYPMEIDG